MNKLKQRYYEELPNHIKFLNGGLKIAPYQILKYKFDEEDYNIIPYRKNTIKDDKVIIPCTNSDINIGDWFIGIHKDFKQRTAFLRLKRKSVINYSPNLTIGYRILFDFSDIYPEYKIINRKEAKKLEYLPHENNKNRNT